MARSFCGKPGSDSTRTIRLLPRIEDAEAEFATQKETPPARGRGRRAVT